MNLQTWVKRGKEKLLSFGVKEWSMVLIVGICCLVLVFPFGEETAKSGQSTTEQRNEAAKTGTETSLSEDYVAQLEARLEKLLSGVKDVGKVKVMVTVKGTVEKTVLQDGSLEREQITESDSAGGSRNSISERSEQETVFYDTEGENRPFIVNEIYPEVTGVVVLCEGSGTGTVDLDILDAVQVLFDVPAHKIKIMKMK